MEDPDDRPAARLAELGDALERAAEADLAVRDGVRAAARAALALARRAAPPSSLPGAALAATR